MLGLGKKRDIAVMGPIVEIFKHMTRWQGDEDGFDSSGKV